MTDRKNVILIIASIGVFFEALDIAIINLAMPLIQEDFHITASEVQWLQTLYVLVYGGFLIVGGKLSDILGRKSIFIVGAMLFLITSLSAGLATSFVLIAVSRAFQGLAAALILPSALAIITNTFTELNERSKAIGIFSSFAAIGSGAGLSIGGLLATHFGWQSVFFINVPVIFCTVMLAWFYIDNDIAKHRRHSPDIISGILITISVLTLSFLVHRLGQLEGSLWVILILLLIIVFSVVIIIRRSTSEDALINFSILSSPETIIGNTVMILLGAFFTGYLFIISLVLQRNMFFTAAQAGLLLFPFSILSAIVAKYAIPFLTRRISMITIAVIGMGFMMTGALLLISTFYFSDHLPFIIASIACVTGMGMSIAFTSLTFISLKNIPEMHHGLGSSVNATSYFFGGGLGLSILSVFLQQASDNKFVNIDPLVLLLIFSCLAVLILILYIMDFSRILSFKN